MDTHSGQDIERDYYSAYLIERGEFTSQLVAAFAGYKPKVMADVQISTDSGEVVEKAKGKRVKLWSVKIVKIQGDRAIGSVSWRSGVLAAGGHTLHLRRKDGKWFVESEKMDWIS